MLPYHPYETSTQRARRWATEIGRASLVSFMPGTRRYEKLYNEVYSTANLLCDHSLYVNLGYWKNSPESLDDACNDLARLLAREAGLHSGDIVIDVGCGFGDQDFLWIEEFAPAQIVGVNIAQRQIDIANIRAGERGMANRVSFVHGSASKLPQPNGFATKVLSLEAAFHFPDRAVFFQEAMRVLRPGGQLVMVDIVPLAADQVRSAWARLPLVNRPAMSMIVDRRHRSNGVPLEQALQSAGFGDVRCHSIREYVYKPFADFMHENINKPKLRRVNPFGRLLLGSTAVRAWSTWMDYVVVIATKPS